MSTAAATRVLTAEQAAAAHAPIRGAWLVAAGPGTGKTLTMVERFVHLVETEGLDPAAVLTVTFTEAAASELRERIAAELLARGQRRAAAALDSAWIGTFHGTCARLLRDHAYAIGLSRDLRVMDEIDQRLFVQRLRASLRRGAEMAAGGDLDPESFRALNPDEVAGLLRDGVDFALRLKGRGIGPQRFREVAMARWEAQPASQAGVPSALAEAEAIRVMHAVYAAYEGRLNEEGRLDFDSLILHVIRALDAMPSFRAHCREMFTAVLVDEFQDTNRIQLELIRLLAADDFANVTVVGDAKQSIYGWRDADVENIRTRFPGRRMPLTRNRRSNQQVLDAATAFIRRDPDFEAEPDLVAERGAGPGRPVRIAMAASPRAEAEMVAREVGRLAATGVPYSRMAILAHSVKRLPREFEEELRRRGVPYVTTAGTGFFDREEVKDVLALMRVVNDPMDDAALARVLQGPVVRVDDAAMYRLAIRRQGRRGMRLRDCFDEAAAEGFPELSEASAGRAREVVAAADRLGEARSALTVADVLNRLLEDTGYLRHSQLRSAREGPRALLNLRKVFHMANRFERENALAGLPEFVSHLDQIVEADLAVAEADVAALEAVRLVTVHGAKGLEFDAVFLVNLRPPRPRDSERYFFDEEFGFVIKWWHDGRYGRHPRFDQVAPSARSLALARQERRRTVYVALTRARDLLWVSASREETDPAAVEVEVDDHFAELLDFARRHPEVAAVVEAQQLPLPEVAAPVAEPGSDPEGAVDAILDRLQMLARPPVEPPAGATPGLLHLSFSDLQAYRLCPVRYRFGDVWRVPAPPDELGGQAVTAGTAAAELGNAVHQALAAWHRGERRSGPADGYAGPAAGAPMLIAYERDPLAGAEVLGSEVEFNLRLAGCRVRGLVDLVCRLDGRLTLVDFKTNSHLDAALVEAYSMQLRLYGLAAAEGLLPGDPTPAPRLVLQDLRRGRTIEVQPDPEGVRGEVETLAARIGAGDFELRPEHAGRPCTLCAYRPICPSAR